MGQVKILKASAGSGKTYRLAYEYIRGVVREPQLYRETLAVTFTNKAAEQMKRRILMGLHGLAEGDSPYMDELTDDTGLLPEQIMENAARARSLILHDYSRFAVSTIDKFFQRVARAFFKELGWDFDYTVEIDQDWVLTAAVDQLMEQTSEDRALYEAVGALVDERAREGMGWNVEPDIARIGRELFKDDYRPSPYSSEEITTRYGEIVRDIRNRFENVRALAREAKAMIEGAGLEPTDFKQSKNSFASYIFRLADSDVPLDYNSYFARSLEGVEEWYSKTTPYLQLILGLEADLMPLIRQIAEGIDGLLKDKNSQELVGENLGRSLLLSKLEENIRSVSAEKNRMMIHETAALIHRLVTGNDAPFIYEKIGNAYRRYMIDEFQDTSEKQWGNFLPLLENALSENPDDAVMLIGDVKQSIYRWRGGNWRILFEAERHFEEVLSDPPPMKVNWRSEQHIISFNNALIRRVAERDGAILADFLGQAPEGLQPLAEVLKHSYESFEQEAAPPKRANPTGYVEVVPLLKEEIGERVVETVRDLLSRGYAYRDIAVLVRSNSEAPKMADVLLEAGYPIVSQEALLLSGSPVVEFIMAVFRLAQYPEDGIALAQYNAFLKRGFGVRPEGEEREFLDGLLRSALVEAFERILIRYGLNEMEEAVSFIQALYQVIISYSKQNISDVQLLLEWWEENGKKRTLYLPSEQDAITIMTVHKAKGLEFKCVVIPRCDWDLLPKSAGTVRTTLWAEADPDEAERFHALGRVPVNYKKAMEQSYYARDYYRESVYSHVDNLNLLYVALTRAERELYVMYDRNASGEQRVSKLIDAVLPEVDGLKNEGDFYSYGVKEAVTAGEAVERPEKQRVFSRFPSSDPMQKIRVRWMSDRYFGEDREPVSPRRHGVVMHKLFEEIDRGGEIPEGLQPAFRNPLVAEWFGPGWQVNSEREIITPAGMRRPDRVITRDGRAVVVDYKFGAFKRTGYLSQVREYMELLSQMGYADVKGYIWYVELDEVEEVL